MPRLSPAVAAASTTVASCVLVAVLVVGALSLEFRQAELAFFGAIALIALLVLLTLPVQVLPALALVIIVLIPDRITDVTLVPVISPATVVLGVWLVRRMLSHDERAAVVVRGQTDRRLRRTLVVLCVLLTAVMVPLTVISPAKHYSVSWLFTFVVAVLGPLLIDDTEAETRLLAKVLPWIGALAVGYALLESSLQRNPIYAPIYDALGKPDVQHWAVYRSDGSLGHPLLAGLFFAVLLAFAVGRWVESRRFGFVLLAVLSGFGVVATVSRGSYASVGVAIVALLAVGAVILRRGRLRLLVVLVACAGAAFLALNSEAFIERGLSTEALKSVGSRSVLPQIAWETARAYHFLGGGPGAAQAAAVPFNFQGLPIENSYLQLLISIGLPGLLLFVGILAVTALLAIRHRNLGSLAALVAYATAISGFAALDTRRNLLVLLGMLILLCIADRRTTDQAAAEAEPPAEAARPHPVGAKVG